GLNSIDLSVVKLTSESDRSMHSANSVRRHAMKDLVLSRRQLLKGAGAVGVLGAVGIPATAFAEDGGVDLLRCDLVQFLQCTALAGGTNQASVEATGAVGEVYCSGH